MSIFNNKWLLFIVLFIILGLVYAPIFLYPYAHHDDYRFWQRAPGQWTKHVYHDYNVDFGRPLSSFLLTVGGWAVNRVSDLNYLRLFALLCLSGTALGVFLLAKDWLGEDLLALMTAVLICVTPPFQLVMSYVSYFFVLPSVLASTVAVLMTARIPRHGTRRQRFLTWPALWAVLAQFYALLTYPSSAMFFWPLAGIMVLGKNGDSDFFRSKRKKSLSPFFLIGFAAMALYFICLKTAKVLLSDQILFGMYNPYRIDWNIAKKLIWFVKEPLLSALNVFNVFPTWRLGLIVLGVISVTVTFFILSEKSHRHQFGHHFFLWPALALLSFLPSLLAAGYAPFYRCLIGLTTLVVIGLIWSLRAWPLIWPRPFIRKISTVLFIAFFVFGLYQARRTLFLYRVWPSFVELKALTGVIRQTDPETYDEIRFAIDRPVPIVHRYDEFGMMSFFYSQNLPNIMLCAAREAGKEEAWRRRRIKVSYWLKDRPRGPGAGGVLTIDPSWLYQKDGPLGYLRK